MPSRPCPLGRLAVDRGARLLLADAEGDALRVVGEVRDRARTYVGPGTLFH